VLLKLLSRSLHYAPLVLLWLLLLLLILAPDKERPGSAEVALRDMDQDEIVTR